MTEDEIDTFHGRKEDRTFDVKREPPRTDRLVQHIQGGANGIVSKLVILIGAAEQPAGKFDKAHKTPITFPLKVEGQKNVFKNFDTYRLHLMQAVKGQTNKYFEGLFNVHDVAVIGGSMIVIEVPKSPRAPHQNTKNGAYYIRRDGKTDKMTHEELFEALPESASREETEAKSSFVRDFIKPGDVIVDVSDNFFAGGVTEVRLIDGPLTYLRVIPLENAKTWTGTQLRALAERQRPYLSPLGRWSAGSASRGF